MADPRWTPTDDTPKVFARLSGDHNPVHLDPEHARAAGFDTVIVHGMNVLGAAARAAHTFAPDGTMLRVLDVRFAKPVLPGQTVSHAGAPKERPEGVKIALTATLDDAESTRIMNPASFTFGRAEGGWDLPRNVVLDPDEKDVHGDAYTFTDADLDAYRGVTAPDRVADGEGVPPMAVFLGMTGALEKAFKGVEPEKPGTWVHLRQTGVFYAPVAAGVAYRCRIQGGRTIVRNAKMGAHVTIPFVVEAVDDDALAATGSCVLLYAFDKEEA
jgi:hypothetical protein